MAEEIVAGRELKVVFDARRCIHSRHCVLLHPEVFVPNVSGEWIHPDRASAAAVVEVAHRCPSGAIRYRPVDARLAPEAPPQVNTVSVRENGPLALHADLELAGEDTGFRATLCRCGQSARKPYCDGAHARSGFSASGEPATAESAALAQRAGPLVVKALENGPLELKGNVELVSGTGRTLNRLSKTYLCRCGQSRNKPYCDGSHQAAGFRAAALP